MFKITPNPTFTTNVELHVPGEDTPGIIKITFKYLDKEQLSAWQKNNGGKSLLDALSQVITGWDGIEADDGSQAEYSVDNLKKLLSTYHSSGQDITQAFLAETLGARRKN